MRNLFVCHTQAQLTLACGLALGRFNNDNNEVIIYRDFALSDDMESRIRQVFLRVLLLQGIYPSEYNTYKAKLLFYPKGLRHIRNFIRDKYDHVFVTCDTVLITQKIMKYVWRKNHSVQYSWIEDGILAYYHDTENRQGLDRNAFTRLIREILFKYVCGVGRFYDRVFYGMGGASCIEDSYVLLPNYTREPYHSTRPLVKISSYEYHLGLKSLYPFSNIGLEKHSIILVLDLLSRYQFPKIVRNALGNYIQGWTSSGYVVYCKFLPRETETWDIFNSCVSLESTQGVEGLYMSLLDCRESIQIVGVKSTGLMTAKLLGFEVTSLFRITQESNENLLSFYQAIGINVPDVNRDH